MSEATNKMIEAAGLKAPRLTPEHIKSTILAEQFYVFPGTTVTVCCLTLKNGYNTIGHSAAVSPDNFREDIGRAVAKDKAVGEIWALEGYLLKERLDTPGAAKDAGRG